MKRRTFLRRCGVIIVAGLSAIPFSKKIVHVDKIKVLISAQKAELALKRYKRFQALQLKAGQTYTMFLEDAALSHLLILDGSPNPVYMALSKVENGWLHYERNRLPI